MPKITKNDLIYNCAISSGSYRSDVRNVIEQFFTVVGDFLKQENSLEIRGFGTFLPKVRKAKNGRNLQTGEFIPLPECRGVSFKFSEDIKSKITGVSKVSKKSKKVPNLLELVPSLEETG